MPSSGRSSSVRPELAELRSRFITQASHEFRTPLAVILASSEALERYGARLSDDDKRRRFTKIRTSIQHMIELLDDVLAYGRAESGKLACTREPTDLVALCREVVLEAESTAAAAHQLTVDCSRDLVQSNVDPKLVRQILRNLVTNAVKYSPKGTPVHVEAHREADGLVLRVRDRGIGIPPEDVGHLFEAFHRGANVGKTIGFGLGLAITQQAVTAHGGDIRVESVLDQGTTFTVRLVERAG